MSNLGATLGIKVHADAKQAIGEFKKLERAQEGLKNKSNDYANSFMGGLDAITIGLAKFNLALGGIQLAIGLVSKAWDLAKNAAESSMSAATKSMMEAAKEIKKFQGSAEFKQMSMQMELTSQQLGAIETAANRAAERGLGKMEDVYKELVKALQSGNADAFEKFGIHIRMTGDHATDMARAMSEITRYAKDYNAVLVEGSVAQDAFRSKVLSTAGALGTEATAFAEAGMAGMMSGGTFKQRYRHAYGDKNFFQQIRTTLQPTATPSDFSSMSEAEAESLAVIMSNAGMPIPPELRARMKKRPAGGGGSDYQIFGEGSTALSYDQVYGKDLLSLAESAANQNTGRSLERDLRERARDAQAAAEAAQRAFDERSLVEGMRDGALGGLDSAGVRLPGHDAMGTDELLQLNEIVKQLGDSTSIAGGAFGALSSGITAAVDAAIAGGDGMAMAFLKASAASLRSMAIESTTKALYHGALAIGALAFGDPKGAALHGIAAGKFAATAAAAGVGSAALGAAAGGGGGGGAASAGPAGGGFSAPRGGSDGGGNVTNIFQIGSGAFVGDEKRLAEEIHRTMQAGERSGRTRTSSVVKVAA